MKTEARIRALTQAIYAASEQSSTEEARNQYRREASLLDWVLSGRDDSSTYAGVILRKFGEVADG